MFGEARQFRHGYTIRSLAECISVQPLIQSMRELFDSKASPWRWCGKLVAVPPFAYQGRTMQAIIESAHTVSKARFSIFRSIR